MINIILAKYPGIQGVTYWETQYDGTPWDNPIDGLVWENKDIPKPTEKDIEQWKLEFDLYLKQEQARQARVLKYPPIVNQLDMLYHDKVNNTNIWVETITAIKKSLPIPTEVTDVQK